MTPIRLSGLAAITSLLAASHFALASAHATQASGLSDAASLHALLIDQADNLVPSVWQTGEPAPESALAYWILPEIDVEAERSAECSAVDGSPDLHDCTLSFVSIPPSEEDEPVTALYRFTVRESADGALTLDSPAVRWAVIG